MKRYVKVIAFALSLLLVFFMASCEESSDGNGNLTVALTDAPITLENGMVVEEVNLVITRVDVVKKGSSEAEEDDDDDDEATETKAANDKDDDGSEESEEPEDEEEAEEDGDDDIKDGKGVTTVYEGTLEFNLLDYADGEELELGDVELEAGDYLQLRLVLDTDKSTIKFEDDETQYSLTIPSGTSSGLKIKGNGNNPLFTITEGEDAKLLFDMDAEQSIVVSSTKDGFKIKPVIKSVKFKNQEQEYSQE